MKLKTVIIFLCGIILFSSSIVNAGENQYPEFWSTTNFFEVKQIDIQDYPQVSIDFQHIYHGCPLSKSDKNFINRISLWQAAKQCSILYRQKTSISPKLTIHALIDLQYLKKEQLDKLQGFFSSVKKIKKDFQFRFYASQPQGLIKLRYPDLYEFIGNKNPNFVRDVVNLFNKIMKNKFPDEQIFLLIADWKNIKNKDAEILKNTLSKLKDNSGIWYAVLYADYSKLFPDPKAAASLKRCLFVSRFFKTDDVDLQNNFKQVASLFQKSYSGLRFQVADIRPLNPTRIYQLVLPFKNDTLKTNFKVSFDQKIMQDYFVKTYAQISRKLIEKKQFKAALDSLHTANRLYRENRFRDLADTVFHSWANYVLNSNNEEVIPDIFSVAENKWHFSTSSKSYANSKTTLLKAYLVFLEKTGSSPQKQIKICDEILKIEPANRKYRLKYYNLKGNKALNNNDYWAAADYYKQAYYLDNKAATRRRLLDVVKKGFRSEYNKQRFNELYANGKPHLKLIDNLFDMKYMYGKSCYHTGHYGEARRIYEWLLNYWNDNQKLVSWDQAFERLQSLYMLSLKFDNAFSLIQQIYRTKPDQEKKLFWLIVSLRAKYLMPALDVFPLIWNKMSSEVTRDQLFNELNILQTPEFVRGIYVIKANAQLAYAANRNKQLNPPDISELHSLAFFPALLRSKKAKNVIRLINRLGKSFVVIETKADYTLQEDVMLQNIQKQKMNDQPWYDLYVHEENQGLTILSEIFSTLIGLDYVNNPGFALQNYWRVLAKTNYINYVVLHNNNGQIVHKINFQRNKARYEAGTWQKSSRALAFFRQEIIYNGKKTIDISNPIYSNKKYYGVLRIGFKKY